MGKRKILLYSRDAGSANTIMPLVSKLLKQNFDISLFGKDTALKKYLDFNLSGKNISQQIQTFDYENISSFIKSEKPNLIITGAGGDISERLMWKAAEKFGIPSIAILDQWINYGIRFSKYALSDIHKYKTDKTHLYLPSKILVMDKLAKKEKISEGIDGTKIIISGHPYFDFLKQFKKNHSKESTNKIKASLSIPKTDYVITFASEPITKTYSKSSQYWGYTEKTILQNLLTELEKNSNTSQIKITLVIKLHPREQPNNYDFIKSKHKNINIIIDQNTKSLDIIMASDLVCGMSSMFLLESLLLEKPMLSIQIGLHRKTPFVLEKIGVLESIRNNVDLYKKLNAIIFEKNVPKYNFKPIEHATENVINFIKKILG